MKNLKGVNGAAQFAEGKILLEDWLAVNNPVEMNFPPGVSRSRRNPLRYGFVSISQ
ncbi:MAG TPA: hypothetical protein VFH22_08675 [Rhodocyclaceae bacterium]|nr:hypothetical protein [Rhodocyclaceae bacterium]